MSFNDPRCKAYSLAVEVALWIVLGVAIVGLWGFSIYKFVEAL